MFVNCSSDGLGSRDTATVFDGQTITLQTVRTCQPVFSAAVIAHAEAAYDNDALKNSYCLPVPTGRMVLVVEPVVRHCGRGPVVLLTHFTFRM